MPAAEVPDRDFRVAVGERSRSVAVPQGHSLVETVRDLRKAGEVTSDAMQLLQRGILTADAELRKGNTAGRLLALQDVRLTLHRLPADGVYTVRVRYANAIGTTQTMTLTSGTHSVQPQLPSLPNWDAWSDHEVSLPLSRAAPLTFAFGPDDNGTVNLDSITLEADPGVVGRHRKEHP